MGLFSTKAQEIESSIDRDTIKIGEQITYKLEVEANRDSRVVFPQGQSFLPLEVIDSTTIDTFLVDNKYKLTREYPLTQFDSGAYTIPRQTVIIDEEGFYSDSFHVKVNGIVVDTLKQNLYPIKPALDIKPSTVIPTWLWWVIGIIIVGLLTYYFWRTRKRIIEKKKELPPYEKAIQTLKLLDETQELESGNMKEYYSGLSNAIKRYIDEKIDGNALESTTNEFIEMLREYKKEKQIYLKAQVIDGLEAILKRADLAKFAGIQTDKLTAREDRETIEENINEFDQAIPEPTEEEKMQDEAYRLKVERKARKRRIGIRIAVGVLALLIAGTVFVTLKGFDYVSDLVNTQSTEKLLKKDWIKSEYGAYGITLTTPDVLRREMQEVPHIFPDKSQIEENFSYGNIEKDLYIKATNIRIKKGAELDSIDVEHLLDTALGDINASMMTFKDEEFITLDNQRGQKIFGTFTLGSPDSKERSRKNYTFLLFNERGGIQELLITYNQGDDNAEAIEQRVVNSIEFNTEYDG
ncbi:MAG TPA: BatD family protein [Flavobacteriaceae bacterium]|nr:BatD family protein [Flavobacteriaceae bacterium]